MPFHNLPSDMAEAIMDHLPSVYHLYLCAQVCRAWRHHAHKVMEPRRRRMMESDQTVDGWEASNRPSAMLPYSNVVDHFAQHSFRYATLRAAYLPKFDFYVAGTGQKLDLVTPEACQSPFRGGVGLWMGTSSSVDAVCAVGDRAVGVCLTSRGDPWSDDVDTQTLLAGSLQTASNVFYVAVYAVPSGNHLFAAPLPGRGLRISASPSGNRILVDVNNVLVHLHGSVAEDGKTADYDVRSDDPAFHASGKIGSHRFVWLCGDEYFYGALRNERRIFGYPHVRTSHRSAVRMLRDGPDNHQDGVSSMCFLPKVQHLIAVATSLGNLEIICAAHGTPLRLYPRLKGWMMGNPSVSCYSDTRLLIVYNTKRSGSHRPMLALVPIVF